MSDSIIVDTSHFQQMAAKRRKEPTITHNEAFTANRRIMLPEVQLTRVLSHQVVVPLRGYAYTMAVCHKFAVNGNLLCAGWIQAHTLGYNTVKQWIKATGWVDGGY